MRNESPIVSSDQRLAKLLCAIRENMASERMCMDPFPHVILPTLLDRDSADALLAWFECDARWELQESDFYSQDRCRLLPEMVAGNFRHLLSRQAVDEMRRGLEEAFENEFDRNRFHLTAHRLRSGQGIGIHTDHPTDGTETHRLVIHFTRQFEDANGGHLCFFTDEDPEKIVTAVRPVHNSAVAFALSRQSFHAVSTVKSGLRFSLVYSFWDKRCSSIPTLDGLTLDFAADKRGDLLQFLLLIGAAEASHSGRTLHHHLVDTARVLSRWRCDAPTVRAGLFHSVYGAPSLDEQLLDGSDRDLLRQRIGSDAETVCFAFALFDRKWLFDRLADGVPQAVACLDGGPPLDVSPMLVERFVRVFWANVYEQDTRLCADNSAVPFESDERGWLAEAFEASRRFLPDRAASDLATFYSFE